MKKSGIQSFLESVEGTGIYVLATWVMDKFKYIDCDVETEDDIVRMIIEMNPMNIKTISNITYIMSMYASFIGREDLKDIFVSIDRKMIWEECLKVNPKRKNFISKKEFDNLIYEIEMFQQCNILYYSTLLRCIFEGIYSDDMSVIINLRGKDLNFKDKTVTLRPNNKEHFVLSVSENLLKDLRELSEIDYFERLNRYGMFTVNTVGLFDDSCFKIESRGEGNNFRYSYFYHMRKILKEYLGRSIKPSNIYLSGLVYRIIENLKSYDMTLEYAVEHPRLSYEYIKESMDSFHYERSWRFVKQTIYGRLDEFYSE